jgi:hypothetical protein
MIVKFLEIVNALKMKTSLENLAIRPSNSNSDLDAYSTIIEKNCFLYFFNILIFETKINIIKFKF